MASLPSPVQQRLLQSERHLGRELHLLCQELHSGGARMAYAGTGRLVMEPVD